MGLNDKNDKNDSLICLILIKNDIGKRRNEGFEKLENKGLEGLMCEV